MTRRSAIILLFVGAFLIWGFGSPLLTLYLNRQSAAQDQQLLLSTLRGKYPDIDFQPGDVAGYTSPRAVIQVLTPIESAIRVEIRRFLELEKANETFGAIILLQFKTEKGIEEVRVEIWPTERAVCKIGSCGARENWLLSSWDASRL